MWLLISLLFLLGGVLSDDNGIVPTPPPVMIDITTPAAAAADVPAPKCFHLPAEDCRGIEQPLRCKSVGDAAVICCHLISMFELKEGLAMLSNVSAMKSLHIRNATLPALNASFTDAHHHLAHLTVTDGRVTRIIGQFRDSIACLNLSGNAMQDIDSVALAPLHRLTYLDVSRNNLTQLPALKVIAEDFWLDISGTNELHCNNIQDIMKQMINESRHLHFSHDNNTYCLLKQTYNWFNATERVPLIQLEAQAKLARECPNEPSYRCVCTVQRVHIVEGKQPTFPVGVDCSGQQLLELPKYLPPNTVSLNVSNNNISSLDRLSLGAPGYQTIREFYADNNRISSINFLEGSKFFENFAILSLQSNEIKTLPTYYLSKSLHNARIMKLGHNKLICNCETARDTKMWLVENQKYISDHNDIQCENTLIRVSELDQRTVCVDQRVWTDYIYYIIAGEVTLLILLVAKVSYDYWVFKTAGYLPWPASKMPKLPCDRFFER